MTDSAAQQEAAETLHFQAEVSRLLDIVVHSLYSEREIFLRELISNASDACDRLRYLALTEPGLLGEEAGFRIELAADKAARTLTIADNGIGMDREELVANLGTIARSGTSAFLGGLSGDQRKDVSLIGQFGVGFYSAFMVADRVSVTSRKAGEAEAHRWESDGKGSYRIAPAVRDGRGTTITLHLREDAGEFLEPERLKHIVRTYSDHIAVPVLLDGAAVNRASALWTRPKSDITGEQYTEFYRHAAHAFDEPWLTLHWRAEGMIEYTGLLFVPTRRPFDLFNPERKAAVKLYVRRVFITDDCPDLLPAYLRFLRGVIDSEDLPLNVSREMLQKNPVLRKIQAGIVKRVLAELAREAEKEPARYAAFWEAFGAVLKEGLYSEDGETRAQLLKLARFRSSAAEGWSSLADYAGRMKEGQEAIYTIAGDDLAALADSPQLEGFRAKGVEVLYLTDPIDEFWTTAIGEYEGKPIRSVTKGAAELSAIKGDAAAEAPPAAEADALIALLKLTLKDAVKDVRASERLTDSACCLIAAEGDIDMHLERLLRQHRQVEKTAARILEVNPGHALIRALAATVKEKGAAADLTDAAFLLLDQARILEGEPLPDPKAFARRLATVMARGL
ncbi:MAG: molecular chaperone HtpG [Thalassobaculales bacterium]